MITKTKILIISILCLIPLMQVSAQHVSVNLKVPPPNQLGVADLWNLTLNNTTQNTLKVYLEGTVDEASDGRILEARSKEFDLSPGIRLITANDVSGANVTYKNNKYKEVIIRTGNAPPGNYNFCVHVKLQDGIEAGSDCKMQSIMNLSPPALVSPSEGLAITETYPSFSWMPPSPISPGQNITYSIKIVEMRTLESPDQAIKRSGFEAHEVNRNFFQYPVSASGLEKGKSYAWQVTAFENGSTVGKSEIWNFSVEGVPIVKTQNFKDLLMVLSGIVLELDRTVYPEGTSISAKLYIDSGDVNIKNPAILYSAPQSKDVEAIKLVKTSNDSVYETEKPLPIKPFTSDGDVKVNDGYLTLKPNEMFFGIYVPKDSADMGNHIGPDFISDFGIMEDKNFRESPYQILSQLAMTDDEINIPPGGKRIGTVTVNQGLPIQLPVDELVIYPRSQQQLRRFLQKVDGEIIMTNVNDSGNAKPTGYLVRVHTDVRLEDFSQVRALVQKTDMVYASNANVLRIITLCIESMMDGYLVEVNPRLQFGNAYSHNTKINLAPTSLMDIPKYNDAGYGGNLRDTAFNIPKVWSYMSLWDADDKRIPVAVIDMGFNYCPDFRGTRDGIIEYDMKTCSDKPRSAEGPPTVGNSFFGEKSWHGTGVMTVAGGVVSDKFGSAGTGGQVVEPILISVGLVNYAFEMGKGMKIATDKGANIINVSGGYPCKFLTTILPPLGSCAVGETMMTCKSIATVLSAAVFVAAEITCATLGWLPFGVGPAICAAAKAAAWTTFWATEGACNAFFLAGNVKIEMESGVNYALSKGVTVVSISGNKIDKSGLPNPLDKIVNTNNMNVDDWMIIPGVLPGVICVAACDTSAPYANQHYFGSRVDIWAPMDAIYWGPQKTDKIEDDPKKLVKQTISATSSATPYISGLIADMQALNDDLNPKKTSLSDKSKIPGIIRDLLVNNAYRSGVELTVSAERRNMVNPLKTLIAASPKEIRDFQDFTLKEYNTSIGYDEIDAKKKHDDINSAYNIAFMPNKKMKQKFSTDPVYHGVVGLTDGTNHKDVDWFSIFYPSDPGVYGGGVLQITIPNGNVHKFGRIKINGVLYPPVQNKIKPDESTIELKIPDMLYGCDYPIRIEGYINEDNVYNLKFIPGQKVGDAPAADKLDDISTNPFGKPNNDNKTNATPLYNGPVSFKHAEFIWSEVKTDNLYKYYEINVKDLNFHICGDEDWFQITPPPGLKDICGHMMCSSRISLSCTNGGNPVNVLISVYDNLNNTMNENVLSGLEIECANPSDGYPIYVKLWGGGAPIKYDLNLSVKIPVDLEKYIAKCDETWKWVQELKYSPIKLNQNWWCEFGNESILFQTEWTNNGGINWSQGGMSFLMQGLTMNGNLSMQLFNSQGNLVCQSFSTGSSPSAGVMQNESPQGLSILSLEQPNLQEGTYYLMLSGSSTQNQIQLMLPRNLISMNLPAIEDFQDESSGNFSSPQSSSYTLIPAFTNQTLIFR